MAAETVDTLEIEIRSRANEAATKVRDLATSLSDFGSSVSKYLGGLKEFASVMSQIASAARDMSKISNLKSVLKESTRATKKGSVGNIVPQTEVKSEAARAVREVKALTAEERRESAKQYNNMIASIKATRSTRGSTDIERENRWLTDNTPERIARERASFENRGKLGQWQEVFGNQIPSLADKYLEKGMIDESTAQAMKDAAAGIREATSNTQELNGEARMTADEFANSASQADLLQMKLEATGAKLEEALNSNEQEPEKIARLTAEYQKLKEKIEGVGEAAEDAGNGGSKLQNILSRVGSAIDSSLIGKLKKVATTRSLRSIVKSFASGIKEGITNLYNWSSAVNGSFAGAMNTAESKITLLKNSFATALAPAIEALTPILSTFVSWIRTAANYVAQFLAMLTGSDSWTKALETTEKWGDNSKKSSSAAKKASDDVKDLLADWDELNIIQSETSSSSGSGSGGSGKSKTDTSKMFETVTEFNKDIKALVTNLKENFGSILNFVGQIAAVILSWKVSSAFAGIVSTIAGLVGTAVTIGLVFELTKTFTDTYLDTGNEGWLFLSLLTPVVGGFISKALLTQIKAFGLAKYSVPISLAVGAAATIYAVVTNEDVSALDERSVKASIIAAVEGAGAAGLFVFKAGALSAGKAALYGTGWGLVTFGVAVGLRAVADVVRDGKITYETIKADLTSAAFVGGGLALAEVAAGAGVATALTLGGVGAVLTLGALIGIQAIIAGQPKAVVWGNQKLTEEEIQSFVENHMFKVKPSVKISLINAKVTEVVKSRQNLRESVEKVIGTLYALNLGLDKEESLSQLKTDVFGSDGLLARFNKYAEDQTTEIQTVLKLVQFKDKNGEDQSGKIANDATEGWSGLTSIMDSYKRDLEIAFSEYDNAVDDMARQSAEHTIETITGMMAKVSEAVAYGKASASYLHPFEVMVQGGLSQETVGGILDFYSQTLEGLKEQARSSLNSTAEDILAEATANLVMSEAEGITDEQRKAFKEKYDQLMADYETMIAGMDDAVDQMVQEQVANSKGKEALNKYLLSIFDTSNFDANTVKFETYGGESQQMWSTLFGNLFTPDGTAATDAKDKVQNALKDVLTAAVGRENADQYIKALDLGILSYNDLFSTEIVKAMAEAMGLDTASDDIRAQFVTMINEIFNTDFKPEEILPELRVPVEIVPEVSEETDTTETSKPTNIAQSRAKYKSRSSVIDEGTTEDTKPATVAEAASALDTASGTMTTAAANVTEAMDTASGTMETAADEISGAIEDAGYVLNGGASELPSGNRLAHRYSEKSAGTVQEEAGIDRQVLEDYWDALRDLNGGTGDATTEQALYDKLVEVLGKDEASQWYDKLTEFWNNGGFNTEDIPDSWFSGSGMTVDAGASGMAMESTLTNLEGTINGNDGQTQSLLEMLGSTLRSVEEYTRLTANKDFTVVISPSSAMGGVVSGSNRKRSLVTGKV